MKQHETSHQGCQQPDLEDSTKLDGPSLTEHCRNACHHLLLLVPRYVLGGLTWVLEQTRTYQRVDTFNEELFMVNAMYLEAIQYFIHRSQSE